MKRSWRILAIASLVGLWVALVANLWLQRAIVPIASSVYGREAQSDFLYSFRKMIHYYNQYTVTNIFDENVVKKIRYDNEISWLLEVLTQVKLRVFTQREVHHRPGPISDFLLGVGYCDQVNGIAARLFSKYYERTEVWALVDQRSGQSSHSIGRVWSNNFGHWLYFDIWGDYVTLFKKYRGSSLKIIANRRLTFDAPDSDFEALVRLYNRATDSGYTLTQVMPTFSRHLLMSLTRDKKLQRFFEANTGEMLLTKETVLALEARPPAAPPRLEDIVGHRFSSLYFSARLAFLRGDTNASKHLLERLRERVAGYRKHPAGIDTLVNKHLRYIALSEELSSTKDY